MKTADLMDEFQEELQSCSLQFRNYGGPAAFFGPCRTVSCHQDNLLVKQLLESPGKGAVLVVDGGGSLETALLGDLMAELGRSNGWAGAIIHGAVRDTLELGGIDFGVKALGSNPRKSLKQGVGHVDTPVTLGGATFRPGQWIYCDADGVVIAERELPLEEAA